MIAQSHTSYNSLEMNPEGTIEALLAMLGQRSQARLARWDCDVCGMIHMGQQPQACDSCGSKLLTRHADIHIEMNNHW